MGPKRAKSKAKPLATPGAATTFKNASKPAQAAPVKKKKKHDPLRPQPAWLFPPEEENPILNPRDKSKEEIQKEIDDRLAAIKFLEHKSVTAPVKTAPPSELLQLIGGFFASYGFVSTGRIFSLERNARKKLEGWNDQIGEKKFARNQPDLVKIFKDWRADWEGDSEAETSSSDEDSEGDAVMKDAESSSEESSDDSSEDERDSTAKPASKSNGVKIRTKLKESIEKKVDKKRKATDSSSSSSSESESESEEEKTAITSTAKALLSDATTKVASASDSESSSESDSESESASDEEPKSEANPIKSLLNHIDQTFIPAILPPKAASDSSETLKGNSPTKELSPSVSSSSASSSTQSDSGSSSASSEDDTNTKTSAPKTSRKRKTASPISGQTEDTAAAPSSKKVKTTNDSFSRIPKDIKIDPRLASNKYVSYDYADKAHRDLVVTKGKGFTKEKNKKKRGAYRGGRIDTDGGKAIKFDD